ncbi:MAG: Ig-like domain-containing protein [Candidatus Koribacter versatilis]|uniref:Ig-like domain-containing protein n=1 Tax=Candidatus Korobacter versatilis TaxID=658062 RepID=A0A932A785_9BACT|nr:Ig-like domain-containing protein [Candidatus Koribacter versatilis]
MKQIRRKSLLFAGILLLSGVAFAVPVVTITAPTGGSTAGSPVQVSASATSSRTVTLMQIYVDGTKKYEGKGSSLSTTVSIATGSHRLTVQAFDSSGAGKLSVNFSVSTATSTALPPLAVFNDIDEMTDWASCDSCAGPGGAGPTTPHSMKQSIASPAMDGKAAEFWLGGDTKYAAALWWKQLGARDSATKFTYDLYFYLKNPSVSQALEFDANQTVNGSMYVFGTQCNLKGSKQWDIWDYNLHWIPTGIPCTLPAAYAWHHLTFEFERSNGKMHYLSITLDGKKSYVDRYQVPRPKTTRELNVAVQLDGNSAMTDYSEWVDKISLKIW